jgi:hypothetical protein
VNQFLLDIPWDIQVIDKNFNSDLVNEKMMNDMDQSHIGTVRILSSNHWTLIFSTRTARGHITQVGTPNLPLILNRHGLFESVVVRTLVHPWLKSNLTDVDYQCWENILRITYLSRFQILYLLPATPACPSVCSASTLLDIVKRGKEMERDRWRRVAPLRAVLKTLCLRVIDRVSRPWKKIGNLCWCL